MIEARFDDLTGQEPSFRLVEPVGVLEAATPAEVAGVIEAADAAAARGLWVAGFVAYEAAPGLDPAMRVRARAVADGGVDVPLAWFAMFEGRQETALPEPPADAATTEAASWTPSVDRAAYDAALETIHAHIAAGETYQVNHTLRLRARVHGDPRGLYRDLCFAQRGAYGAYVDTGRVRVLSASPELFFRLEGDILRTKPMKGTAPRGRYPDEDEAFRAALESSAKDRAENAMIVDLIRNDLGRVAREGSVRWSDVFRAERFETVWQLTSTVEGRIRAGIGLVDVFRALFPSGSVTGAPKVSTMAIIAALEDSPRGVYCGTVGYVAPAGSGPTRARFNVAIRTVAHDAATGAAEYGVGGGITWDSRAAAEFDEVVAKARVLTARRPPFALFETMRADPGGSVVHLDRHLDRLLGSASYFGFAADRDRIRAAAVGSARAAVDRPHRIRLVLDRTGRVETTATPVPPDPGGRVRVAVDRAVPVDPTDVFLFHKTTLRTRYEDARARHPDAADVVLTNTRGEVTESTIANVAVRLDGGWWTPPLDAGLLAGVGRAVALEEGRIRERALTVEEFMRADEVALVSDNRGWRPAEVLDR